MKYMAAALAVVCVLLGYGWQAERAAHANTNANHSEHMAALFRQAAEAGAINRKIEKELSDATIKHANQVADMVSANRRLAVRNADDAGRLRNEAAAFASRAGAGGAATPAAGDLPSTSGAALVLADLFGRADSRAGELAQALDEARIRGLACEADYTRVIQKLTEAN